MLSQTGINCLHRFDVGPSVFGFVSDEWEWHAEVGETEGKRGGMFLRSGDSAYITV